MPAQPTHQIGPEVQFPQPDLEQLPAVGTGQIDPGAPMILEQTSSSVAGSSGHLEAWQYGDNEAPAVDSRLLDDCPCPVAGSSGEVPWEGAAELGEHQVDGLGVTLSRLAASGTVTCGRDRNSSTSLGSWSCGGTWRSPGSSARGRG